MGDSSAGALVSAGIVTGLSWSQWLVYRQRRAQAEFETRCARSSRGAAG